MWERPRIIPRTTQRGGRGVFQTGYQEGLRLTEIQEDSSNSHWIYYVRGSVMLTKSRVPTLQSSRRRFELRVSRLGDVLYE